MPNSEEHLAALGLLPTTIDKINDADKSFNSNLISRTNEHRVLLSKISNHFVFGNHGGLPNSDGFINKTSNNKLDQSYKISYADMCDVLKNYKSPIEKSIESVNEFYDRNFFSQWLKLMK